MNIRQRDPLSETRAQEIESLLDELRSVMTSAPYLRLGQIISNISSRDPFFVEDDELIRALLDHKEREE